MNDSERVTYIRTGRQARARGPHVEAEVPWQSLMDRQKDAFGKSSGLPGVPAIERRTARRFNMALRLRYTLQTDAGEIYIGEGVTRNISSGGVLFMPDEGAIPAGFMHIAISWPVLNSGKSMELCFAGQAVRAEEAGIAVQALRYELTTADCGRLAETLIRRGKTRAAPPRRIDAFGPVRENASGIKFVLPDRFLHTVGARITK